MRNPISNNRACQDLYAPIHVAYADPPYPGQARKHYKREEVDHKQLIARLTADYPNGWALSTSSSALQYVLSLCPDDVRIGAWVKPFAIFKRGVNPAYAWEPVIWRGGRVQWSRSEPTIRDWVSCNITLRTGTPGAKPAAFCNWVFSLLGLRQGDILDDLYIGSGAVTRAWHAWEQTHE